MNQRSFLIARLLALSLSIVLPTAAGAASTHLPDEAHAPPQVKEKLKKLRKQFGSKQYRFKVGYTSVSHLALGQITGLKLPARDKLAQSAKVVNERARHRLAHRKSHHGPPPHAQAQSGGGAPGSSDGGTLAANDGGSPATAAAEAAPDPTPVPNCAAAAHYDLRAHHLVTPVRDQGQCGSCWDFSAMGAFESSFARVNQTLIDASEQQALDCSAKWSCGGGWYMDVFNDLESRGIGSEADVPYRAAKAACNAKSPDRYFAEAWGFVHPNGWQPTVPELKAALCEHGAVSVTVDVTASFQNYTGGVFNEHDKGQINHAVTLIGWDEPTKAWLIKNQWGTGWGEDGGDPAATRGYMWIAYDSNSVGYAAAWVEARGRLECDVRVMAPKATARVPQPEPFNSTQLFLSEGECQQYAESKCSLGAADYRLTTEMDWKPACH